MILDYGPASVEDIGPIFEMSKNLIDTYEDVNHLDYGKVIAWVQRKIELNIAQYTCIYAEGKKVGYFRMDDGGDMAELDDLYILPPFRGRGIGTQVLQKCLANVRKDVFLFVFKGNIGAIRLYKKLGFNIEKEVGSTRYIMRKPLTL